MKYRGFLLRLIPVVILMAATVVMSFNVYGTMVDAEEETCWERLELATRNTAEKIKIRLDDNISFLQTVADAYVLTNNMEDIKTVGKYLNSVVEMTVFQRIDIILPDNSIITQEGEISQRGGESGYDELVEKGTHISSRVTSSFTGKEVICCVTPIIKENETLGMLVGTISCDTLNELFEVFAYREASQVYLIDRADGDYLMDNWHDYYGNIYDLGIRESLDGNGMIDMTAEIIDGKSVRHAYLSKTNGERTYQYSMPVEGYNWQLCVAVQEDVAFANAMDLKNVLFRIGIVEFFLLFVYLGWNISVSLFAVKNERKVQKLEFERVRNEARSKFISNMSHDIKTPLNGIVGMLEIIKQHRDEEKVVDDCIKKIEISAKYLSTLTSDMLDINEIENDKLVLQEESINLCRLLDEMSTMIERQAKDSKVMYCMDHSQIQHPNIVGSPIHIKRILVNLISNAIKYSKKYGREVWVTAEEETGISDTGQIMYKFSVKDNGIGMSRDFQENMYKAFEQERIDARSEYQGYGLGLTIVNYLVKKMNGTIELESEKGVGSTFTVRIPFTQDMQEQTPSEGVQERIDLSGLKILLVEDNEFNQEIAKVLLSDAGAVVDCVSDGKAATEVFEISHENYYDLIIMDIMMPIMDGCEATKVIRRMTRRDAKTVPIIAMTASTFSEDVQRCKEAGMNAHVPKPLDLECLMTTIAKNCNVK